MSVGTPKVEGTTYFIDSSRSEIDVPAGLYEATASGPFTLSSASGDSFLVQGQQEELCAFSNITGVGGYESFVPETWNAGSLSNAIAGKAFIGAAWTGVDFKAVAKDLSFASSTSGSSWSGTGTYGTALAPTVVWTATGDAGASTSYSLVLPTGAQPSDIVVVHVGSDASLPAVPSGWTAIENTSYSTGHGLTIYKVMGTTPDTSIGLTGLSEASAMVALCVRGVSQKDTVIGISNSNSNSTSGMPNNASKSVSVGDLIIATARLDDDSVASTVTAPAGYENLVVAEAAGLNGQTVMAATKTITVGGTEDPGIWGGSGDHVWYAVTIQLEPNYINEEISTLDFAGGKYFGTRKNTGLAVSNDLSTWGTPAVNSFTEPAPFYYTQSSSNRNSSGTFYCGVPASSAGDLLILIAHSRNGSNVLNDAGWTTMGLNDYSGALNIYYKESTGAAAFSVSMTTNSSGNWASAMVIKDADASSLRSSSTFSSGNNQFYSYAPTTANNGDDSTIFSITSVDDFGQTFYDSSGWQLKYSTGSSSTYGGIFVHEKDSKAAPNTTAWGGSQRVFTSNASTTYRNFSFSVSPRKYKNSVAFGASTYVSVGKVAYRSSDANYFTQFSSPIPVMNKVRFINGNFWMVGEDRVAYSANGISWATSTVPISDNLVDISSSGGLLRVVGLAGLSATSPDGISWTVIDAPSAGSLTTAPVPQKLWATTQNPRGGYGGMVFKGGLQKGDLVIVGFIAQSSQYSLNDMFPQLADGWKPLSASSYYSGQNYIYGLYYKFMDDYPDSGFIVQGADMMYSSTQSSSVNFNAAAAIAFRGVQQSSFDGNEAFSTNQHQPGAVDVTGPSYVTVFGLANISSSASSPAGYDTDVYRGGTDGIAIYSKYIAAAGTESPGGYGISSSSYPAWDITLAIPLTGAVGGSSGGSSGPSYTSSLYRSPYFIDLGNAGTVQSFSSGSASVGVSANLSASDSFVGSAQAGAQIVGVTSAGRLLYSGSINESVFLKKVGDVIVA
jgi:hypothetical protein